MALYQIFTPPSLDSLDLTTPGDTEEMAKYAGAIRQAKSIITQVFLAEHYPTGKHRELGEVLAANSVGGDKIMQHSSDDSRRAISTNHIRDRAVTVDKLALSSLDGSLIVKGSIGNDQLGQLCVDTGNIKTGAITSLLLGANSVNASHIGAGQVNGVHLAVDSLGGNKISDKTINPYKVYMAPGSLLCGGAGGGGAACVPTGLFSIAVTEGTAGNPGSVEFKVAAGRTILPFAHIDEKGSNGGSYTDGLREHVWTPRIINSVTASICIVYDIAGLVTTRESNKIVLTKAGTYFCMGFATAFATEKHQVRLRNLTNDRTELVGTVVDASRTSGCNAQSQSSFAGLVTTLTDREVVQLQHYVATSMPAAAPLAESCLGKGFAVSTGEDSVLASILFIQLT